MNKEDVQKMWDNMPDKSWSGLMQTVQGMGDMPMSDEIKQMVQEMEDKGAEFPSSPEDLYNMMSQRMGQM